MIEVIVYRYRGGIAWRDVPAPFGPWQTIWAWHRRISSDGAAPAPQQWRGLATRYDKLPNVYRTAAVLHVVIAWTTHLSDTPQPQRH